MESLKKGYSYKLNILEKTGSGARFLTIVGKVYKIDECYIWINGESFRIDDIVNFKKIERKNYVFTNS